MSRRQVERIELKKVVNRLVVRAIGLCKEKYGLKNIWDLIKKPPMDFSFKYNRPNSHMKQSTKEFYEMIWADYSTHYPQDTNKFDEAKSQDNDLPQFYHYLFTKGERIRICNSLVRSVD